MDPFDVFVIVDWSASSTPKLGRDSIWSCVLDRRSGDAEVVNHRTRAVARGHLQDVLVATSGRVLIGFDFSYAYPTGTAAAAQLPLPGVAASPWSAMWDHLVAHIVDGPHNQNNRFAVAAEINWRISSGHGPFWGTPMRQVTGSLAARKAPGFAHLHATGELAEFRLTEQRFLAAGLRVSSTWQLLGAGSVGSQTLTGIPVVHRLRHQPRLAGRSRIWPFETGFSADPTSGRTDAIVHAEIWPGMIPLDPGLHEVRDAAQVIGLAQHLAGLDRDGAMGPLFDPPMTPAERVAALAEEGWILGAPDLC